MSLIKCPECSKKISDKAKSCPNCGYKIRKTKKSEAKKTIKDIFQIIGMLHVLGFFSLHKNIFILIASLVITIICYYLLISILDYLKE